MFQQGSQTMYSQVYPIFMNWPICAFLAWSYQTPHGKPHEKSGFKNSSKELEKTPDFRRNPVFVWLRGKDLIGRPPGYRFAPACGTRKNLRAFAFLRFFRPLRCVRLPLSATGGGRLSYPTSYARRPHNPESSPPVLLLKRKKGSHPIG